MSATAALHSQLHEQDIYDINETAESLEEHNMRLLYLLLLFATWLSIGVAEDVGLSWAIEHLPGCAVCEY